MADIRDFRRALFVDGEDKLIGQWLDRAGRNDRMPATGAWTAGIEGVLDQAA